MKAKVDATLQGAHEARNRLAKRFDLKFTFKLKSLDGDELGVDGPFERPLIIKGNSTRSEVVFQFGVRINGHENDATL